MVNCRCWGLSLPGLQVSQTTAAKVRGQGRDGVGERTASPVFFTQLYDVTGPVPPAFR